MSKQKKRKKKTPKKRTRIKYEKKELRKRTELLNDILRIWFHHFDALEKLAVLFIYDRTLGWNKEWEVITFNQFSEGVFSYSEEVGGIVSWAAPFSRGRGSVQKVIKRLLEKGVIKRERVRDYLPGKRYQYSINQDWEVPAIYVPKRAVEKILARRDLSQ